MDYVRSCYKVNCRFWSYNDLTDKLIWYFAKPGAPVYGERHSFGSLIWQSGGVGLPENVGEVAGANRAYRDGSMFNMPNSNDVHGKPFEYLRGQDKPGGILRTATGTPLACTPPVPGWYDSEFENWLVHGIFVGGGATLHYNALEERWQGLGSYSFGVYAIALFPELPVVPRSPYQMFIQDFFNPTHFGLWRCENYDYATGLGLFRQTHFEPPHFQFEFPFPEITVEYDP